MTETQERPRRWVTLAGIVLFVVALGGTRETRTSVCTACRTRIETTTLGLTFGGSDTLPVWRFSAETPCPAVSRFLGPSHEHGGALVSRGGSGPKGLFLRTNIIICGSPWWRDAGLGGWIEREPRLADGLGRRIDAGTLDPAELRAALTLEYSDAEGDPTEFTAEQEDLLRRMAAIIAEELGLERREVSFGPYVDLWREEPR